MGQITYKNKTWKQWDHSLPIRQNQNMARTLFDSKLGFYIYLYFLNRA